MTHLDLILSWLTLGFEAILFSLVYARGLQRRLPFFAAYATVLISSTLLMLVGHFWFGSQSIKFYYANWITVGIDVLARSLVVAELCRYELRAYRGIWALTWRALLVLTVFLLAHATVDAWGQPNRIAIYGLVIERDADFSALIILATLLLIRKHYGFSLDPLSKSIASGILFLCAANTLNNTLLRDAFTEYLSFWFFTKYAPFWSEMKSEVVRANEMWNLIRFSSFMVSMGIWCLALRKPLPADAKGPVLLPAEVYRELSPALNLRLRAFNDRLQELLKT
jgi:hypothetical protein